MDCAEVMRVFAGERGEDLDEVTSRAFESHLGGCDPCREALARAEADLEPFLDRLEAPELPEASWARVTAAVEAEAAQRPVIQFPGGKSNQRGLPLLIALAAAVLLALGAGLFVPLERQSPIDNGQTSKLQGIDEPGAVPPGEAAALPPGKVLALLSGPRFDARPVPIDDLLIILVTEKS